MLQIIIKNLLWVVYKQIIVQIGRCVSNSKFNVFEGRNINQRNKRIFHIKIFVEPL